MDTRLERDAVTAALRDFVPSSADELAGRAAAVVIALGGEAGDRRMILTKRPSRMRAHPGQFALPGGSIDPGETPEEGALRELAEEVGIAVGTDAVLGRLDDYVTRSGFVIRPFVVWVADAENEPTANPEEVEFLYSVSITELDVDARFVTIEQSPRPVIQWPFRQSLIHAPTGAIVHQFREVVLAGRHTRVAEFEQPVFAWR
ncbi:NUDIX hydrolase [Actinomycetes bacterium M1A6_2h]